jgi:hypothetical protein
VDSSLTHGESNGRSRFPDEYDFLDQAGQDNLDEMEKTVADRKWDVDLWRSGSLSVATEPHQVEWLKNPPMGTGKFFSPNKTFRLESTHPPTWPQRFPRVTPRLFTPRNSPVNSVSPSKMRGGNI